MSVNSNNTITLSLAKPVFRTLMLGTGILATKMLATNLYSAFPSAFAGYGPPEDSAFWRLCGLSHEQTHGAKEHHDSQVRAAAIRASRIVGNDLENIPLSLVVFWTAALANPKSSTYVAKLFTIFVAARCAHSVVYLAGVGSGIRSAIFMTGLLSTLRAMVLGIRGVGCAFDDK